MGTNYYYAERAPCAACGREYEEKHIGKRSGGWKFHLEAENRDDTWEKMKERLRWSGRISNEYGETFTLSEMIEIVESWQRGRAYCDDYPEESWRDPDGYVMSLGAFE